MTVEKVGISMTVGVLVIALGLSYYLSQLQTHQQTKEMLMHLELVPSLQNYPKFTLQNDELIIDNTPFEKYDICAVSKTKPFYNCEEKWHIYYLPNIEGIEPNPNYPKWLDAGFTLPQKNIIVLGNMTMKDNCGMSLLSHELKNLEQRGWNHNQCYDDAKGKVIEPIIYFEGSSK